MITGRFVLPLFAFLSFCPAAAGGWPVRGAGLEQSEIFYDSGRYRPALPVSHGALGPGRLHIGSGPTRKVVPGEDSATVYLHRTRIRETDPSLEPTFKIAAKAPGPLHPDVALTLNNLAMWSAGQARYTEAESRFTRALEIQERVLGPDHPNLAVTLDNLAVFYRGRERYAEAEPLHQRAPRSGKRSSGRNIPRWRAVWPTWPGCIWSRVGASERRRYWNAP